MDKAHNTYVQRIVIFIERLHDPVSKLSVYERSKLVEGKKV